MTENINELIKVSGIEKIGKYIFWTKAEIVKPFIISYLKNIFSKSLIIQEFNFIDILIVNEKIPVEIQTISIKKNKDRKSIGINHSVFEDRIRRQIESNIENYNICWFFFDFEYYKYLNESTSKNISMNLDWFSEYVKEKKLKIFTIRYNGEVYELKYEDLSFIKKISNTCKMSYKDDERILNRNKLEIINKVLEGYNFTQDEIDKMIDNFNKRKNTNFDFKFFLMKENDEKMKLYGYILHAMTSLSSINNILDMSKNNGKGKYHGSRLGIFETHGRSADRTEFVDKFNICQYFPGYIRNKEMWNKIKNHSFNNKCFENLLNTFHDKNQTKLGF